MSTDREVTVRSLVEQLRENTGRHMLDSGGAYGRGWERWAKHGETIEEAVEYATKGKAEAHVDARFETLSVNTVTHLADLIFYHPEGDAFFERWVEEDDEVSGSQHAWLESAERFVAWLNGQDPDVVQETNYGTDYAGGVVNTYNHENLLDETLQYVVFVPVEEGYWEAAGLAWGEPYVLLQTHNGCDMRGGYSRPRLYALNDIEDAYSIGDPSLVAYHEVAVPQEETLDLPLPEREREHRFDLRVNEWTDMDGSSVTDEDAPHFDEERGLVCPCGETLEVGRY